jgi:hypothetical protein
MLIKTKIRLHWALAPNPFLIPLLCEPQFCYPKKEEEAIIIKFPSDPSFSSLKFFCDDLNQNKNKSSSGDDQ